MSSKMSEVFETACPQCAYNEMRRLAIAQGLDPEKFLHKPLTPTNAEWRALCEKLVGALNALTDEADRTGAALSRMGQGATALGLKTLLARKALAEANLRGVA